MESLDKAVVLIVCTFLVCSTACIVAAIWASTHGPHLVHQTQTFSP